MTEGGRPPRPRDPDGTLVERAHYWLGFLVWLLLIVVLAAAVKIYRTYRDLRDWLQSKKA